LCNLGPLFTQFAEKVGKGYGKGEYWPGGGGVRSRIDLERSLLLRPFS